MNLDIHFQIVAFLVIGWLVVWLLTEYLFRIEHRPRTWVHRLCFVVYRTAVVLSRQLNRIEPHAWFVELPYKLLPLPLCRIGYEMREKEKADLSEKVRLDALDCADKWGQP